jgi:hypothetical protein
MNPLPLAAAGALALAGATWTAVHGNLGPEFRLEGGELSELSPSS